MQRIVVVIVTFNNAAMLRNLLADLSAQSFPIEEIIVVDNASVDNTPRMLSEEFAHVTNIRLSENTGSAGGYYTGIKAAMGKADGIWTLDDDVHVKPDTLKNLVQGYIELSKVHRLGAVRSVGANHSNDFPTELEIAPWRGTLWVGDVVRLMGSPRKDYFLYGEDLEYSLRMHKFDYCCYWVPSSCCVEVRQEKTDKQFLGRTVRIYPTPFRLYYAFRNEMNIYLAYHRIDKLVKLLMYALKVIIYIMLTEQFKAFRKCKAIYAGLVHGTLDRLGKNERFLP